MTVYYLIRNNQIVTTIEADIADRVVFPVFGGGDAMSLLNKLHADNLMANLSLTAEQALDALGISDLRASEQKTIFIARSVQASGVGLAVYKLIEIGEYAVFQVNGQAEDLLSAHDYLWTQEPAQTLGMLAVVNVFGASFYDAAVRSATGMTNLQAAARRDRLVTFLNSQGFANTATLAAATTEHQLIVGLVEALGYTITQLWGAMK